MWCCMIWHDVICCVVWHAMWCDMIWYVMLCVVWCCAMCKDMLCYDMVCCDMMWCHPRHALCHTARAPPYSLPVYPPYMGKNPSSSSGSPELYIRAGFVCVRVRYMFHGEHVPLLCISTHSGYLPRRVPRARFQFRSLVFLSRTRLSSAVTALLNCRVAQVWWPCYPL